VRSICLRILKNPDDADDLTQEVFFLVLRKIDGFKGGSQFVTWLHSIASNRCLMELRTRRQRRYAENVSLDELMELSEEGEMKHTFEPEAHCADPMTMEQIRESLPGTLSELQRRIFLEYCYMGEDHIALAKKMEMTVAGVKSSLHHARMKIAEHLAKTA